jgi:hypothetical protein
MERVERVIEELDEDALPSNAGAIPGVTSSPVGIPEVNQWLARARPGERLVYFAGCLMEARCYSQEVDEIAGFVMNLSDAGRVRLFQYRLTDAEKIYLAEKLPVVH